MYNQVVITWLLLLYSLKSGVVLSPAPSLDCFGSSGLLWFHTNFRMIFPIFLKNAIRILIKIVLNLQMSLGCMKTLTIFILPMQEYEISFHLQIFHFLKVCFILLYFYKRHFSNYFHQLKEIWRELLYRKKKKWKAIIMFNICFATRYYGTVHTQSSKSGPTNLLSQELLSVSQHQVIITLNCVIDHLYCISTYFMHLLARCVLR